jgi:hypothetical protein
MLNCNLFHNDNDKGIKMFRGQGHRIKHAAALTLMAGMLLGCSDPHKFEIAKLTEEQKQEMGKKLTADEGQKLTGYLMRTSFASKELPAGVTVGQAIKEQELWLEKEKVEAAKAEELKKKVEAERKAKQEAFAKMLSVALVAKRNNLGEYDQRMVLLDLAYENKSDRDIAGVKGVLHLNDMFGDKIMNIRWSFDEGVGAKQTAVERGNGVKINQFIDDHMKLWSADPAKIKANYEVQTIVFKDGTRLDAPE